MNFSDTPSRLPPQLDQEVIDTLNAVVEENFMEKLQKEMMLFKKTDVVEAVSVICQFPKVYRHEFLKFCIELVRPGGRL